MESTLLEVFRSSFSDIIRVYLRIICVQNDDMKFLSANLGYFIRELFRIKGVPNGANRGESID